MSRVGKLPIIVPNDIKVELKDNLIKISKGSDVVEYDFGDKVDVKFENNEIKVSPKEHFEKGEVSNFYGLHRNNIANIVKGLIKPFEIFEQILKKSKLKKMKFFNFYFLKNCIFLFNQYNKKKKILISKIGKS